MALPKLNSTPKYELTIPSTGETVSYRPFLVKEEKVLMIALESNDNKQMLNAMVDTIKACINEDINLNKLTSFDMEYIFLQLRAKSVGETAEINMNCEKCGSDIDLNIKLDDIKVDMPKDLDNMIKLDDVYTLEMAWPKFKTITNIEENKNETDQAFEIIASCMIALYTDEEKIDLTNEPLDDVKVFIESMNREQFSKVQSFIDMMPKLEKEIEYSCNSCGQEHKTKLEGVQSFF